MGRPQNLLGALYHNLVQQSIGSVNKTSRSLGQGLGSKDTEHNQLRKKITASL